MCECVHACVCVCACVREKDNTLHFVDCIVQYTVVLAHHAVVHITIHRVSEGRHAPSPPIPSHLRTSLSGTLMDPAQDRQRGTTAMCTLPQWPFIGEYLTVSLSTHVHTYPCTRSGILLCQGAAGRMFS